MKGCFDFSAQRRPRLRCWAKPWHLPVPAWRFLLSDRTLYQEGQDEVHFCYLDFESRSVVFSLWMGSALLQRQTLKPDPISNWSVANLPAGQYLAQCGGVECHFQVARYVTAPLLARCVQQRVVGGQLELEIELSSYERAFEGEIQVRLFSGYEQKDEARLRSQKGRVWIQIAPTSEVDYRLTFESGNLSAELPLPGSGGLASSETPISTFYPGLDLSTWVRPGGKKERGLCILERENDAPLELSQQALVARRALLEVLVVWREGNKLRSLRRKELVAGARLELPPALAPNWLLAAAVETEDRHWEGLALRLPPPRCRAEIVLQGQELSLKGQLERAWVVVKDARASSPRTPASLLDEQIREAVQAIHQMEIAPPLSLLQKLAARLEAVYYQVQAARQRNLEGRTIVDLMASESSRSGNFCFEPDFARTHFQGIVRAGEVVTLDLPPGSYRIEALAVGRGDWDYCEHFFQRSLPLQLGLRLPVFEGGKGQVQAVRGSGELSLQREGQSVLRVQLEEGQQLEFPALAGQYQARFENSQGQQFQTRGEVQQPGQFRQIHQGLIWLRTGQSREAGEGERLRLLSSLREPKLRLLSALGQYPHLCCEQTAARALMGAMLLAEPGYAAQAEAVLWAGLGQLQKLCLPGRGFAMYANGIPASEHWNIQTLLHLRHMLVYLKKHPARSLVKKLLSLAYQGSAYRWPPEQPSDFEEAYLMAVEGLSSGVDWVRLAQLPPEGVEQRRAAAFGAATLLRTGCSEDLELAQKWAHLVLSEFLPSGMLYSTLDSCAAAALLQELQQLPQRSRCRVNGQEVTSSRADEEIQTLEVLEGLAVLQATSERQENWLEMTPTVELMAEFDPALAQPGQTVTLQCSYEGGYQPGDLLWLALGDGLLRLEGGSQLKWFSQDFAGLDFLSVELSHSGEGAWAIVLLRNMYQEERCSQPLRLELESSGPVTSPQELPSLADFRLASFRKRLQSAQGLQSQLMLEALLARVLRSGQVLYCRDRHLYLGEESWQLKDTALLDRLLVQAQLFPARVGVGEWDSYVCSCLLTREGPWISLRHKDIPPPAQRPLSQTVQVESRLEDPHTLAWEWGSPKDLIEPVPPQVWAEQAVAAVVVRGPIPSWLEEGSWVQVFQESNGVL